jgi:hypothetical protein
MKNIFDLMFTMRYWKRKTQPEQIRGSFNLTLYLKYIKAIQ